MKNEITSKDLEQFKKSYSESIINSVAANTVQRNGVFNSAYQTKATNNLDNIFSIEVKETGSITNQKQSGRCWMFSGLNVIRNILIKNLHVKDIELSESYLMFYDKLEKCNYQLEAVLDTLDEPNDSRTLNSVLSLGGQQDGGFWNFFVELVKKYGICPKQAMVETNPSSSSYQMNSIINSLITKDTATLRNKYAKGVEKEKLAKLKTGMLEEIYRVLAICIGIPCQEFTFEYNQDNPSKDEKAKDKKETSQFRRITTTPIEFFKKYVEADLDNYILLVNWPINGFNMYQSYICKYIANVYGTKEAYAINVPLKEMKSSLIKSLKDGKLSWFACDVGASSARVEGYLATEIYDFDSLFSVKLNYDKGDRLMYKDSQCTHAMTITGVNLVNNKPNKWKVENSWGEQNGFKGYYVMSDSWFNEYVYEVVVEKQYLSEEVLKALDTKPIQLPPWAPVNNY